MSEKVTDPVIAALLGETHAAQAEVARLREALRDIADGTVEIWHVESYVDALLATDVASSDDRDPVCIERWPECEDGAYHPSCCRFPKSCSCG